VIKLQLLLFGRMAQWKLAVMQKLTSSVFLSTGRAMTRYR